MMLKRLSSVFTTNKAFNYSFLSGLTKEENIIAGHSLMLTPGIHQILVKDTLAGRSIMKMLLRSLGCYQSIGCLSLNNHDLEPEIIDIYSSLSAYGYLDTTSKKTMQDFLWEEFNCDFIWIELTTLLNEQLWYAYFYQAVKEGLKQVPIFVLTYAN